tara:strand:- start:31 stop:336 length:306 start_codon:yes stop_codon:yes gene_type:complete
MATLEEFKTECRSELQALRDGDGIYKQVNNERLPISDDDFEQMVVDCANSKFDQQENGYKTARQEEYPSYGEQLDYIFHNGLEAWKTDIIQPIKDNNPKPE